MTELPDGWADDRFGDVLTVRYGKALEKSLRIEGGPVPVVGSAGTMAATINPLVDVPCIVIGRKGNVGEARLYTEACWPIDTTYFVEIPEEFVGRYLELELEALDLRSLDSSTTTPSLRRQDLDEVRLRRPPQGEQLQIVQILDTQLARLDTVLAAVQAVRDRADQLRRSLLHAAFTGQLTQPVRNRSVRPASWFSRSVGDVVKIQNGYAFKSAWFVDEGVALARGMNIGHGSLDWQDRRSITVKRALEFERFQLCEDDLLLALDRPIISTGLKWAVVTQADLPCLLLQRVARLRASAPDLLQEFLQQWLQSPQFISALSPGRSIGVPHISTKEISSFDIPLPPVDEQREIIRVLDAQLARLESVLRVADQVERECGRLRRSLLQAAFTGELTKTWREANG